MSVPCIPDETKHIPQGSNDFRGPHLFVVTSKSWHYLLKHVLSKFPFNAYPTLDEIVPSNLVLGFHGTSNHVSNLIVGDEQDRN